MYADFGAGGKAAPFLCKILDLRYDELLQHHAVLLNKCFKCYSIAVVVAIIIVVLLTISVAGAVVYWSYHVYIRLKETVN